MTNDRGPINHDTQHNRRHPAKQDFVADSEAADRSVLESLCDKDDSLESCMTRQEVRETVRCRLPVHNKLPAADRAADE